jgi:hypothetical protein
MEMNAGTQGADAPSAMSARAGWIALAVTLVAVAASMLADKAVFDAVHDPRVYERDWGRLLRVTGFMGTWVALALAVGLHDAGARPALVRPRRRAWLLLLAPGVAGLAAEILKIVIRRERRRRLRLRIQQWCGRGDLAGLTQVLFHLKPRHHQPSCRSSHASLRRRLPLQEVIEPLLHAHGVVLLVGRACEAVVLADVLEQHDFLAELAQRVVVRDPLVEVHRAVAVVVQDHERDVQVLREAVRRVAQVGVGVLRVAGAEAPWLEMKIPGWPSPSSSTRS